jgi:hypothetical protein
MHIPWYVPNTHFLSLITNAMLIALSLVVHRSDDLYRPILLSPHQTKHYPFTDVTVDHISTTMFCFRFASTSVVEGGEKSWKVASECGCGGVVFWWGLMNHFLLIWFHIYMVQNSNCMVSESQCLLFEHITERRYVMEMNTVLK